jgi:protein SCO1/2
MEAEMAKPRMMRYAAWAAVAAVVIVLVGAGYAALNHAFQTGYDVRSAASIGGPFRLVSQTGATVTDRDLVGHPSLMFFGYTSCPDVCPTTLADTGIWLKDLGDSGSRLAVYFVTVDPERDTEAQMARYLTAFDPRITGLTGAPETVAAMLQEYRVYYRKVPAEDGSSYTMDHVASIYMLDPNGQLVGTFDYTDPDTEVLAKLKHLVGA